MSMHSTIVIAPSGRGNYCGRGKGRDGARRQRGHHDGGECRGSVFADEHDGCGKRRDCERLIVRAMSVCLILGCSTTNGGVGQSSGSSAATFRHPSFVGVGWRMLSHIEELIMRKSATFPPFWVEAAFPRMRPAGRPTVTTASRPQRSLTDTPTRNKSIQ